MNVSIRKSFIKDVSKIKDKKLKQRIANVIENVRNANSIDDIPNLKKISGYEFQYRIRIGNYRAGLEIIEDDVAFVRFGHRKDFYNFFP